jgi:bifunctional pyridoxal-dependent enzyme with beta-cystathionase and maltose regulon repressor activities
MIGDMDFPVAPPVHRAIRELVDRHDFGTGGEEYARLNLATSQAILLEILERMAAAVRRLTALSPSKQPTSLGSFPI